MNNAAALGFFEKRQRFLSTTLIPRHQSEGRATHFLEAELEAIALAIAALDYLIKVEAYEAAQTASS
jgi:hypothetical protein